MNFKIPFIENFKKKQPGINNNKNKKIKKKKTVKQILGIISKTFLALILIFVISMSIILTALTVYVVEYIDPETGIDLNNSDLSYATFVYAKDKEGNDVEVGKITSGENRVWIDLEEIPNVVRNAFIYTEDERFEQHEGVDWKRTFGAFSNLVFNFWSTQQGGSTITQQLVKNITKEDSHEIQRKVTEIFQSMALEKRYSKDQILESYLNIIHMGYNTGGVQAASKLYFNKDVKNLNAMEAAALAGMTKNPTKNDPIKYPNNNKKRRNYTLTKMLEYGAITKEEFNKYYDAELQLKVNKSDSEKKEEKNVQSFFVDNVITEVVNDFVKEKGYTAKHAEALIKNGGYKIYCTMDMEMQKRLEEKFADPRTFSVKDQKDPPQAAFVVYDYNGEMKAVVGERGVKTSVRGLNRATQSIRSPGSTIKPIASYGLAVELNIINYSSLVLDKPIPNYSKGKAGPNNYNAGKFLGNITSVQALQRSQNTVPVKLVQELTPQRVFTFMEQKLGISTLTKDDYNLAGLGIGALTHGLKLSELTAAYTPFGNKGVFNTPRVYTKIVDSTGNVVIEKKTIPIKAFSEETAGVMNMMLRQVVEGPNGTGKDAKIPNIPVSGKTGTSDSEKDLLFIGCNPYYVGGVWLGYDKQKTIPRSTYNSTAKIYSNIMGYLIKDLPPKDFDLGSKVVEKYYCARTGLLANQSCPTKLKGYYKEGNLPKHCNIH